MSSQYGISIEMNTDSVGYPIYRMNEIHNMLCDLNVDKYADLINWIRTKAPDALIFIEANLHVSAGRSDSDSVFNNANINEFNSRISELADNKKIFYIDVNEIFDDENGNLKAECTSDNTHVLGKYYVEWVDWILTKAIVPEGSQSEV